MAQYDIQLIISLFLGRSGAHQQLAKYSNIEPDDDMDSEWSKWNIEIPQESGTEAIDQARVELPQCCLMNSCNIGE